MCAGIGEIVTRVPEPEALVTTTEAARALSVSRRTLAEWAAAGKVKPALTTAGGHYRWDVADLREQLRRTPRD